MFCKHCGAELASDALFCPRCGKRVAPSSARPSSDEERRQDSRNARQAEADEGVNAACIAGCVLTVLSLFINYYGIVSLIAFFVSAIGFSKSKKRGQAGRIVALVSMIVSGVIFASFFITYIQISRYEYAAYGILNRFIRWLEDVL